MSESKIPTVSVIIPAYNRERTIARAIQSVLDPTFRRKPFPLRGEEVEPGLQQLAVGLSLPLRL